MSQLQAVCLACVSQPAESNLGSFFENTLNSYRYELIQLPQVIATIFNEGEGRDRVFHQLDNLFSTSPDAQLVILSEPSLSGMEKLEIYDSGKEPAHQHELLLRHTVSILRTRYKSWPVKVFVPEGESFREIL